MHELLNPPQRAAVLHTEGPVMIYAGAGSGKTRVITHRIAHLLHMHKAAPQEVLAVTFTNKAAHEMRNRVEKLVGSAQGLWVGTFHATCAKLLRLYAYDIGVAKDFTIYDDGDQRAMLTRVVRDLNLDERKYTPKSVAAFLNRAKQEGKRPELLPVQNPYEQTMQRIAESYQARMEQARALDFDDLIFRLVEAQHKNPALARVLSRRFRYLMVDEFQDTNRVQWQFVRSLAEAHQNLCVVGDDDQSIYRWRGADRRNISDFRTDFAQAQVFKLEQNYRSSKRIVRAAQAIIEQNQDREPKALWTEKTDGEKLKLVSCDDEHDEARMVVRAVREYSETGYSLSNMALFYRTHAQSRVLEEALRTANLAYRIVGGMRFYDRAEVKDILAYLRLLHHTGDDVSLLRVLNTPARGIGKTTTDRLLEQTHAHGCDVWTSLQQLTRETSPLGAAKKKLKAFLELIEELQVFAKDPQIPLGALGRLILERTGYLAMLETEDSAEADARTQNLQELMGSMDEFSMQQRPALLSNFLENVTLDVESKATDTQDVLSLMTVHAAKGLEFPIVFVTGMEEQLFPFRGTELFSDPDDLAEERRLAYVALTRAEEHLILSFANTRRLFGQLRVSQPSRFLQELSQEDVEFMETRPSFLRARSLWSAHSMDYAGSTSDDIAPLNLDSYVDRSESSEYADGLRPGMKVRHQKFGVGQVRALKPSSPPQATVHFSDWGVKQVVVNYLEPA